MIKKYLTLLSLVFLVGFSHTVFSAETPFGQRPEVRSFIKQMVKKHHFKEAQLITVFNNVKIRHSITRSFHLQLEENPWYRYQMFFVTEWRIREGVRFWNEHKNVLERAEKTYGVPASLIVATIGVETKYGHSTGGYRVIDALTNLAFGNSPRANFFKDELEQFLLLSREQHLDPLRVMGSYAGAIGQTQFMPSSYRHYAVDFSGDKHIDLSHNISDVIGSIANYYHKMGWAYSEPVAVQASVAGYRYQSLLSSSDFVQVNNLSSYGIMPREPVSPDQKAKLIALQGYFRNEYWLSFHNFDVIKKYNRSTLYAMAVYQLSEYISAVKGRLSNE